jgi:hypothetical protein
VEAGEGLGRNTFLYLNINMELGGWGKILVAVELEED